MKLVNRKWRLALIALLGISITTICIEYLSYMHNARRWPTLGKGEEVVARVLFVADPQIIGERNEPWFIGWLARWDADWYLQKTFQMAKQHTTPDVIVFLGDLFDEGSIASDPEYRRYFQRFSSIFDLPTNRDPSPIKYVFVPGDNDVGGEKSEPVDSVKVHWFTKVFGELQSVVNYSGRGTDVQFVKMNLFMPDEYKDPFKSFQRVINGTKKPDIRIIISHTSLLSFMTTSVETVLKAFQPNLIVTAHSHKSSFLRLNTDQKVHVMHDFLLHEKSPDHQATSDPIIEESISNRNQHSIRLDLKATGATKDVHEILVPTCSYRMGVPNMGYGAMQIYQNGTMEYTVLWLPSRYKQLIFYIVIYILVKIIVTPWVLWKTCTFVYRKASQCRLVERARNYAKIV